LEESSAIESAVGFGTNVGERLTRTIDRIGIFRLIPQFPHGFRNRYKMLSGHGWLPIVVVVVVVS
jgi:hypothetical protein